MIQILNLLGIQGLLIFFLLVTVGIILIFKVVTDKKGQVVLTGTSSTAYLEKKNPEVDLFKYRGLIQNISTIIALAMVVAIFEFPVFNDKSLVDLGTLDAAFEEVQDIPPTTHKPPPPPKIQQPEIVAVPDEEEIEEEIEIVLDVEIDDETIIEEVKTDLFADQMEEEVVDEVFEIVEDSAEPIGGMGAFYEFVRSNLEYPKLAMRQGIEGKVYVQFVVDKDGSITEVRAIRGIGAGCDEEATRVIGKSPKWKPGKQRGRPVKQRMVLPISFKMN